MGKLAKVVVTIIVVFVFFGLFSAIVGSMSDSGQSTPGIFGLILFAGVVGSIRAIWKSDDKENSDDENEDSILQK